MRVRALRQFESQTASRDRGEEFEATPEELAPLLGAGLVEAIEPSGVKPAKVKVAEPKRVVIPRKPRKHR